MGPRFVLARTMSIHVSGRRGSGLLRYHVPGALLGGLLLNGLLLGGGPAIGQEPERPGAPERDRTALEARVRELGAQLLASEVYPGFVVGWVTPWERRVIGFGALGALDPRVPDGRTLFEIGSVTKVFTGLLLADGVVRGEVALEDTLASRLPAGWTAPVFSGPRPAEPAAEPPRGEEGSGAGGQAEGRSETGAPDAAGLEAGAPQGRAVERQGAEGAVGGAPALGVAAAGAEPIRLWHLATHTSGLPRLPPGLIGADPSDPYRAFDGKAMEAALAKLRVQSAPGSVYAYSNLGAGLLGFCLAGDAPALERRFTERLFGPLGLADTRILLASEQESRLAAPHGAGGRRGSRWRFDALAGAGALHSCADDLLRFAALELGLEPAAGAAPANPLAPELLAALELARSERWRSPAGDLALGLGWHLETSSGVRWHNGQTGGYHSYLALDPRQRFGVVVLANASAGEADLFGLALRRLLAGEPAADFGGRAHVALEPAALEPLVGEYSAGFLQKRRVFREGPRLFLAETGAEPVRLYPLSPTRFFTRDYGREFEFEFEGGAGTGPAKALVALRGERRERAKRIVP